MVKIDALVSVMRLSAKEKAGSSRWLGSLQKPACHKSCGVFRNASFFPRSLRSVPSLFYIGPCAMHIAIISECLLEGIK